jgi:uncharacterized integral membrane protein
MKRNDWLYILCIAVFSFLFYEQTAGLNFFLFSIAIVASLGWMRRDTAMNKHWYVSALLVLVSGFAVYLNGSRPAIIANGAALMLFSAQSAVPGTSLVASFFLSVCSVGGAYVFMILDFFDRRAKNAEATPDGEIKQRKNNGKIWAVLVAVLIVLLFFVMYRSTNVLFKELTKHINLDWISWKWCFFTAIGAVVVYGLFYLRKFGGIGGDSPTYKRDLETQEEGNENWGDTLMSVDNERFLGNLLFALLNILVLFVNGVDLMFQFGDGILPEGITYTSYVHQGVGMLIVNVLLAMLLVLFFFRGRINFDKGYKTMRVLAILWMVQNILMLFFMAGRNNLYTEMFGMTYNRIGVYFYLLLTAIGAATIVFKVYARKTNTWLFRINTWLFFSVFVFSSLISWSRFITWYSLNKSSYVNRSYLSTLSYQSLPYLVELNTHPEKFPDKELKEDYEDDFTDIVDMLNNRTWGNHQDQFSIRVCRRVYVQLSDYKKEDWRSRTLNGDRVEKELLGMTEFGKDTILHLDFSGITDVYYFPGFEKIKRFNAGNNEITSIGELASYKNLEEADFSANELMSLSGIEKCTNLRYIDLEGNPIVDYSPLIKLPNLKEINVTNVNDPNLNVLKAARLDLIIK